MLLWTSSIDYSTGLQARIDAALIAYFKKNSRIPQSDADFNAALTQSEISRDELRDPWGRSYYVTFKQTAVYGNRVNIYSYASYGEKPKEKTELMPVTQQINYIYLRRAGEDGKEGSAIMGRCGPGGRLGEWPGARGDDDGAEGDHDLRAL